MKKHVKDALDAELALNAYRSVASHFTGVDDLLEAMDQAEPSERHVNIPEEGDEPCSYAGRKVTWVGSCGTAVEVPSENIRFMEGNQWGWGHAKALHERLSEHGDVLMEMPAGRVHRITAADVKASQAHDKKGDLEEQYGMSRPWTKADMGSYYAQLVDGNHRALAAIAAGEPSVVVHVGENYRDQIRKKDWARHRRRGR